MKIEIVGLAAEESAKSLLAIDGIEGSYETLDQTPSESDKAEIITTIVTIVIGVNTVLSIAERIHQWYKKSCQGQAIEKTMIVTVNGQRLIVKSDTTIGAIVETLEQ